MNNYKTILLEKQDKDLYLLDNFLEFYEWEVRESDEGYNIFDMQLDYYLENKDYKSFSEVVSRVVSRAIDYYINEHDYCDEYIKEEYNNLLGLYNIANKYVIKNECNKTWLKGAKDYIDALGKDLK